MFVYRDEYYLERNAQADPAARNAAAGKAEILVAKQRHGPTGVANLLFDGDHAFLRQSGAGKVALAGDPQHVHQIGAREPERADGQGRAPRHKVACAAREEGSQRKTGRNVKQAVFVGFSHILGKVLGIYWPISGSPHPEGY
jgi:hypothetical protein